MENKKQVNFWNIEELIVVFNFKPNNLKCNDKSFGFQHQWRHRTCLVDFMTATDIKNLSCWGETRPGWCRIVPQKIIFQTNKKLSNKRPGLVANVLFMAAKALNPSWVLSRSIKINHYFGLWHFLSDDTSSRGYSHEWLLQ